MDVRLWGPAAWEFLHAVTFVYPKTNPTEEERQAMASFFYNCGEVLPCYQCRSHFKELLALHPIENNLDSRDQLTRWLVARHNDVNERLGKPTMSYDFVKSKYRDYGNKCASPDVKDIQVEVPIHKKLSKLETSLVWILVFFVIILIVCLVLYKCTLS